MSKRNIEVFSASCPACDDAVELVQSLTCPSCDVQVLDMKTAAAQAKATAYGIRQVPAIVVDGSLAGCCQGGADPDTIRGLGVGTPV